MKIAIYGSRSHQKYAESVNLILESCKSHGVEVVMHRKIYDMLLHTAPAVLQAVTRVVDDGQPFTADYALSLGGDGTFLRTTAWVADKAIPILGINIGHLGYLAGADIEDCATLVDSLKQGHYSVSSRTLIHVSHPQIQGWPYALNEVSLTKAGIQSIIEIDTRLNDAELSTVRADGMILSTPTGSTAYNLSVGGPIVQPDADVLVMTAIAPHSLSVRPLVLSNNARLDMRVEGRGRNFNVNIDGRCTSLPIGETVHLECAPFRIQVLALPGHRFPHSLRSKLNWANDL